MRVIGIDPGLYGAIALFLEGELSLVWDMPLEQLVVAGRKRHRINETELGRILRLASPQAAFLEQVGVRPGEGAVGAFSFGRTVGRIEGLLAGACGIKATEVFPQTWQRAVGLRRGPDETTKAAARRKAAAVFPKQAHLFARIKDDGRADATLLGLYGSRLLDAL